MITTVRPVALPAAFPVAGNPARPWLAASAFLLGAGVVFTIPLVGALPMAELVAFPWAAVVLWQRVKWGGWPHALLRSPAARALAVGLLISAGGYVVADLGRGTAPVDLVRGWARLAFVAVDALALTYLLARDWLLLRWLVAGFITGVLLSVATVGPHAGDYWKFGFAYPLTFLLPMVIAQRRTWLLMAAFAGLGVLHLHLGARSLGAMCLVAAALLWLPQAGRRLRLAALLVSVAVALGAIHTVYRGSGVGERAKGSTTERAAMVAFALDAIAESPWVGHGSWFTKGKRVEAFFLRRAEYRDEVDRVNLAEEDEVVIHSQILVATAEGGLAGGAFFVVLAAFLAWGILFTAGHDFTLRPLVLILLLNAAWDLAMSPFSGSERIFIGLACALVIALRGLGRNHGGRT